MVTKSGLTVRTRDANDRSRRHLASWDVSFPLAYVENGWQGAQPASKLYLSSEKRIRTSSALRVSTSRSRKVAPLLLTSYGNRHAASRSTPARTSIPSLRRPWVRPPAPQKRSTHAIGRLAFMIGDLQQCLAPALGRVTALF
jgi:hypothetical protein